MHKCNHECSHKSVKYCNHCKKIYCESCSMEWFEECKRSHYFEYFYTTPTVQPQFEFSGSNTTGIPLPNPTEIICKH